MRTPMLACGLVLVLLLGIPGVLAHGPPVQADPETNDQLAGYDRTWSVRAGEDPALVDLEGDAAFAAVPGVAFRVHTDVAFLEGVLTVTRGDPPRPDALFNTGSRLQAFDLEPPLRLADGSVLARVFLGPLDFSMPRVETVEDGVATVTRVTTSANVTMPDDNGTAPALNDTTATGLVVRWTTELTDRVRDHPDFLVHSPAAARMRLELVVPDDATAEGVPDDQTVRLATVFDFGGSATGRTVAPGDPAEDVAASGVFLVRDGHWAYTRASAYGYPVGMDPTEGHELAGSAVLPRADATFDAPSYNRAPTPEPASLLSPLAFNVTLPLLPLSDSDPAGPGAGIGFELDFGYQVDETIPLAGAGPTDGPAATGDRDGGDDAVTPAPGGAASLIAVLGALMVVRGRNRLRRR